MSRTTIRTAFVLLIAWVAILAVLSIRGFFANFSALPPRLSFALLAPLPVVLFYMRSQAGKRFLETVRPQWLIYLQSFRILVEIGLWLLVRNGLLPVQLSFEGRNFDMVIGLLALPVGHYCFVRRSWPGAVAVIYNIAGLLSLLNAVAITALSMPAAIRVFHNGPNSSLMTRFPMIYLPGVLIPLAYTLHIFSLRQYRLHRRSGAGGRIAGQVSVGSAIGPMEKG